MLKEAIPPVLLSLLILTLLILAQQVGRLSDILFAPGITISIFLQAVLFLTPPILTITLPFSLLLGLTVALNRLSADSELTALHGHGLSLLSLSYPLLAMGLLSTILSGYLTLKLVPYSMQQLRALKKHILLQSLGIQIKPKTFITSFPNYLLYIQDIDQTTGSWRGVFLLHKPSEASSRILTATSGQLRLKETPPASLEVNLFQGISLLLNDGRIRGEVAAFGNLHIKLTEIEKNFSSLETEATVPVQELPTSQVLQNRRSLPPTSSRHQLDVELHKRLALPLACLVLTYIALQIGTRGPRHAGKTLGLAIGFSGAIFYYLVFIAGQNLALSGFLPPAAGVWLANLAFTTLGVLLTTAQISFRSPSFHLPALLTRKITLATSPQRLYPPITNLVDYLLLSEMLKFLALTLIILVSISLVFTLFDILPAAVRSGVGLTYAITYLCYLTPQIAYYTAPFALLLAILTTYSLLAKTNQITALSASGHSTYRLILPVLAETALVMMAMTLLAETILPYTNREQDNRYHRIKGRRIEQATLAFGQKWAYGLNNTIYSFQYLSDNNQLLNTTAYHLDPESFLLRGVTYARNAQLAVHPFWGARDSWHLTLQRDLTVSTLPAASLEIPDGPELFRRTVNESAKMNRSDLESYLRHLERIGAPTTALRIDLERKRSFPFSCLTLAALSMPFALSRNRKGALTGIGVGIVISLAFWSSSGLLEAAGKQGLLPIWLAAWGGQMLFLALAAYLFSRQRL
jgi:lipopolysaccharide export system permease protein